MGILFEILRIITCITIHRSESSALHGYTMYIFLTEFENLLTHYILTKDKFVIIGDFNFHMTKSDSPNVRRMTSIA